MEGPAALPHERADPVRVAVVGEPGAGRMLCGRRCRHVEARRRRRAQPARTEAESGRGGVELPQQREVVPAGVGAVGHREHGGVLQLPCERVADRAPVRDGCGQAGVREVVAVGQAGQDERGVHGGHHVGEPEEAVAVGGDHLGHGAGLHGVPQFHDRQARHAVLGQPHQFGDQVLAQRAAGAVVDQGRVAEGRFAAGVAHAAAYGAGRSGGQVVVQGDAAGHLAQQLPDGLAPGVGVQPGDDHHGHRSEGRHRRPPPCP